MSRPHRLPPNSLGQASLIFGDRWNVLILREAFRGARRFQDWTGALGVSDPVLAARLKDLTALGMLHRERPAGGPPRPRYRLSEAAKASWQVFVAVWLWNLRWTTGGETHTEQQRLRHLDCGYLIQPLLGCGSCGARGVTAFETSVAREPRYTYDESNPPRRYRRGPTADLATEPSAVDLLGDRWSTSVLAAAFLGAHRFGDFSRDIGTIPPLLLKQRLATFVEARVLQAQPVAEGHRRRGYHLTAKGSDFFGIFSNQISWSASVFADRFGPPLTIRHEPCGARFDPVYFCNACNEPVQRRAAAFVQLSDANARVEVR